MLSHFSCVWLFVTPWAVTCQALQSVGFSRQEYWSGLPCPYLGDFPKPGIKPASPALQADFFIDWASREALIIETEVQIHCHLPLHASLSTSCDLSLDAILFSQFFIGLLTGRLGKRLSHLLVTYSSFLLLWSKEETNRKQDTVWSKGLKGVLGPEMSRAWGAWFKVSYSFAQVTKQTGLPAESFLLLKAAYRGFGYSLSVATGHDGFFPLFLLPPLMDCQRWLTFSRENSCRTYGRMCVLQ